MDMDKKIMMQKNFKVILNAMSHPGQLYMLPYITTFFDKNNKNNSHRSLFSILELLLDHEVSFCALNDQNKKLEKEIKMQTGAHVSDLNNADFIIILSGCSNGLIQKAKRGTLEYPDKGSTLIYLVKGLNNSDDAEVNIELKGPGIKNKIILHIKGISEKEFFFIKKLNSEFPLGVDSIFADFNGNVACIPRSTEIEVK
ncbi:MAG: phosphonate C-P lyase system protein PhnH [Deltaproteobacteria bacterium]|nr:phosphonate C-P lyase system protein PhnH [Deltaproteobacteria bacterium]